MPRDGSGIYHKPFPDVVEGTTIESAVHNGIVADIEQDLNWARPILSGGTGAVNAHDAMVNLGGELAKQGPVTNYDSFTFVSGSFYSNAGATAAPNGNAFNGVYYEYADANYATIEAREVVGPGSLGIKFIRQKSGGTWGAWMQDGAGSLADTDARYVNATGDTMTGALNINNSGVHIHFNNGTYGSYLYSDANQLYLPLLTNAGDPSGPWNSLRPLYISLTSGNVTMGHALTVSGTLTASGAINVTSTATVGALTTTGNVSGADFFARRPAAPTTGVYFFGGGSQYLFFDGTNFQLQGGSQFTVTAPMMTIGGMAVYGGIPISGNPGVTNANQNQQCILLDGGGCTINGPAHAVGTCITFYANGGTFAINNNESMFWYSPGGATSGNRTIADRGVATVLKIGGGHWVISGNGLT